MAPGGEQELRAARIADLKVMRDKFVQLAEAFPQDKYEWRPMAGVRSVSEVLMLSAFEGYSFVVRGYEGTRVRGYEGTRVRGYPGALVP